jgi:hypothetical protein
MLEEKRKGILAVSMRIKALDWKLFSWMLRLLCVA